MSEDNREARDPIDALIKAAWQQSGDVNWHQVVDTAMAHVRATGRKPSAAELAWGRKCAALQEQLDTANRRANAAETLVSHQRTEIARLLARLN